MIIDSTFKFDNYPELLKEYKKLASLRNKLLTVSMSKNGDTTKPYANVNDYIANNISKTVFDLFNGKIKYIYHENDGKVEWSSVFSDKYEDLDFAQKKYLTGLIDGDFVYRLPQEYYEFDPYLEGYYD